MRKRTRLSALLAAAVVVTASLVPSAASAASTDEPLPPAAINNPDVPLALIEALPEVIQNDPDIMIDPELELGPIVYPDGTPVEGQDAATTAAARAWCGGTATAGVLGSYGAASIGNCVIFGSPGWVVGYSWGVQDPQVTVCTQIRGFTTAGIETWYGAGCGTSRSDVGARWGNKLANPAVRAVSQANLLSNSVAWNI